MSKSSLLNDERGEGTCYVGAGVFAHVSHPGGKEIEREIDAVLCQHVRWEDLLR